MAADCMIELQSRTLRNLKPSVSEWVHCQIILHEAFCSHNDSKKSNSVIKSKGETKPGASSEGLFVTLTEHAYLAQWPGYVPWNLLVANAKWQNELLL